MFSDPQSITISAVAQSLPRVSTGDRSSNYSKDDDTVQLTISHTTTKNGRVRRLVRMDVNKIATDPFVADQSRRFNAACYLIIEEPVDGAYTNAELLANAKGFVAYLSDANLTKVLAGES